MKTKLLISRIFTVCYICILAGIIYLANTKSTQSLLKFTGNIPFGDKIGHFFLMGIFALLLNCSLNFKRVWRLSLGSLIVLVIVTIEEISQIFVRGRTFSWKDLVADFLGIIILGELGGLITKRYFFR